MFHLPRQHLPQHNGTVRPTGPCKPRRIHTRFLHRLHGDKHGGDWQRAAPRNGRKVTTGWSPRFGTLCQAGTKK